MQPPIGFGESSKSWIAGMVLLCAAAGALSSRAENLGAIHGTIWDGRTGEPLPGVHVEIRQRTLTRAADGRAALAPADRAEFQASLATDGDGKYSAPISAAVNPPIFFVAVRETGYDEQLDFFARLDLDGRHPEDFALFPENELSGELAWSTNVDSVWSAAAFGGILPLSAAAPPADPSDPLRIAIPSQVYVRDLAGAQFTGWIDLEELTAGIVAAEEGDGFPLEALKAQAVAARSFALFRWQTRGEANGGQAYTPFVSGKCFTAAANTRGIVVAYAGAVIPAYYSARCNGDFTMDSENGPSLSDCSAGGLGAGYLPWARSRPCSGHPNCAQTLEPCCEIVINGKTNFLYGHGVGMCQRGAQDFAGRDGWDWSAILRHYYTEIEIANGPGLAPGEWVIASAAIQARASPDGPALAEVPAAEEGVIRSGPQRAQSATAWPYPYDTWWEIEFPQGIRGWVREDSLRWDPRPRLEGRLESNRLALSWQGDGWILETKSDLRPAIPWQIIADAPGETNGSWRISLDLPTLPSFYRLAKGEVR